MAPRVAPAMRVLPLALTATIFSGVAAILIYLSGLSSCNAPTRSPRAPSPFRVSVLRVVREILTRDGVRACRWQRSALGIGLGGARRAAGPLQQVRGTASLAHLPRLLIPLICLWFDFLPI